jgi:SAM-dependent methyltransferase
MDKITNAQAIAGWTAKYETQEPWGPEGDFGRQHLLNPTIFRLLGSIAGKRILDAGCGQGYLCRLLADRGALVTGVEPAATALAFALREEQTAPKGITYRQADLSALDDLRDSFDAIVANMVFMDIPDYRSAMRNCVRTLKPGGSFVFSLQHPCFEEPSAGWPAKRYVAVHEYLDEFTREQSPGTYLFHRPLSHYLNHLVSLDCALREIVEPRLSPELAAGNPILERSVHVPSYVVIHAVRT